MVISRKISPPLSSYPSSVTSIFNIDCAITCNGVGMSNIKGTPYYIPTGTLENVLDNPEHRWVVARLCVLSEKKKIAADEYTNASMRLWNRIMHRAKLQRMADGLNEIDKEIRKSSLELYNRLFTSELK